MQTNVLHSAQIAQITGSAKQRAAISAEKTASVVTELQQAFKKRPEALSLQAFEDILKKHAHGVDILVNTHQLGAYDMFEQGVTHRYEGNKVSGFDINISTRIKFSKLPTTPQEEMFNEKVRRFLGYHIPPKIKKETLLGANKLNVLAQEARILFDKITAPKFSARTNAKALEAKYQGFSRRNTAYEKFYRETLVGNETKDEEWNKLQDLQKLPDKGRQIRRENIKTGINRLFLDTSISSNEKIDVLQMFRHKLILERNAKSEELQLVTDKKGISVLKEIHSRYFYDDKIGILEATIKTEIAKHRKAHSS